MGLRCVYTVQWDRQLEPQKERRHQGYREREKEKERRWRRRRRGKRKRGWKEQKNERNAI